MKFKESELAHQYLDGLTGIEIGASAHNPFGLDTKNVDYTKEIDVYKQSQIDLCGESSEVDIVSPGDELPLVNEEVDFVISSHAVEHFFDPIKAINEWLRISKKYVFMIIPHKERTFDKDRKLTTPEELKLRNKKVYSQEDINNPENIYFNGVSGPYGHWNVWDTQSFLDLCEQENWHVVELQDVDDKVGNGFTVVLSKIRKVKSLQLKLSNPYYIFAPGYTDTSSGVRALHYLCHALNLSGQEAYVTSDIFNVKSAMASNFHSDLNREDRVKINIHLRTPILSGEIFNNHKAAKREPIVVYPETVTGNPLNANRVIRYILNTPAFLAGDSVYDKNELLFAYKQEFLPDYMKAEQLHIPVCDLSLFNPSNIPRNERKGKYFFVNRYLQAGGKLLEVTEGATELSFRNPRSLRELSEIFKSAELLYSYEPSALCREAMLCGCPVVYLPNTMLTFNPGAEIYGNDGIAWGASEEQIEHAKATVGKVYVTYKQLEKLFWVQLEDFILITQANIKRTNKQELVISEVESVEKQPKIRSKLKIGLLLVENVSLPCPEIRLIRVLEELSDYVEYKLISENKGKDSIFAYEEHIQWSDLIIAQRTAPGVLSDYYLELVMASKKPVIYETDDLITKPLPKGNKVAAYMKSISPRVIDFIENVDGFSVSTEQLSKEFIEYGKSIEVLPNLINDKLWKEVPPTKVSDQIVIAYAGTDTHQEDLKLIEPALIKISSKYKGKISFIFMGCITENLLSLDNMTFIHELDYSGYRNNIQSVNIDIALSPLLDNEFNFSKSNIKWMEYSRSGLAGVYSKTPAYDNVVNSITGLVVRENEKEWFDAIEFLILNPEKRIEIALAAQAEVRDNYTISVSKNKYLDAWKKFANIDKNSIDKSREKYYFRQNHKRYKQYREVYVSSQSEKAALIEAEEITANEPTVRFIMQVNQQKWELLADTLDNLSSQIDGRWALTIFADFSIPAGLVESSDVLDWIVLSKDELNFHTINKNIIKFNSQWFIFIAPGAQLESYSVAHIKRYIKLKKEWQFIYTDEGMISDDGGLHSPSFKPDFNLDLLRSTPYIGDFCVVSKAAILKVGGGISVYDLCLKILDQFNEISIGHIPEVLVHYLDSCQSKFNKKQVKEVLSAHLNRNNISAVIREGLNEGSFSVQYPLKEIPLVSIIIPIKDNLPMLKSCLDSILDKTLYSNYEIIIVDNQSVNKETKEYLSGLIGMNSDKLQVLNYSKPFNFSAMNNLAVSKSKGEFVLFLNNDTEIIQPEWLEEMLSHAVRSEVGLVGGRLVFNEGMINHAGMVLGAGKQGIADFPFFGMNMNDMGYDGRLQMTQNYSAVTASCCLMKKSVYQQVLGMDENNFGILFGDIDLSLKVKELGLKIVWTPFVTVFHHGAVTFLNEKHDKKIREQIKCESNNILEKWLPQLANDSAYNRNLSLKTAGFNVDASLNLTWNVDLDDKPKIYAFPVDSFGVGQYRVRAPLAALTKAAKIESSLANNFFNLIYPTPSEIERMKPDVLLGQNAFLDHMLTPWKSYEKVKSAFKVSGLDDLVYMLPNYHPKKGVWPNNIRRKVKELFQSSDRVIVANNALAEEFKKLTSTDIIVVPNYLENWRWQSLSLPEKNTTKKMRVGWAGGHEHIADLQFILPIVKALHREVDWVFMGLSLEEFTPYIKEMHAGVEFDLYPQKLADLNLDLAIAPLMHNKFNECKTNLRLLEFGIMSWPIVCSDILPYQNAPVTRVANNTNEWIRVIREKINEPDELLKEGAELRQWIVDNYMLDDHIDEWMTALLPN